MSVSVQEMIHEHQYPTWLLKHPKLIGLHYLILKVLYTRSRVSSQKIYRTIQEHKTCISILDIGCGEGQYLLPLAKRFPQHRFTGIDLQDSHIRFLERYQKQGKISNLQLISADIEQYIFPKNTMYSLIYLIGVLQYLPNPIQSLQRIANLQRTGDQLIVYCPLPTLAPSGIYQKIKAFFGHYDQAQKHYQIIPEIDLFTWIDQANYDVNEKKYYYHFLGKLGHEIYHSLLIFASQPSYISKGIGLCLLLILAPIFVPLQVVDELLPNKKGNGVLITLEKK